MITIENARRATELAERREAVKRTADSLCNDVGVLEVCSPTRRLYQGGKLDRLDLRIEHMGKALKQVIRDEAEATISEIDAELRALGFETAA